MFVKPKDPIDKKNGAMYMYQRGELECDEEYTGEHPGPWEKGTRST